MNEIEYYYALESSIQTTDSIRDVLSMGLLISPHIRPYEKLILQVEIENRLRYLYETRGHFNMPKKRNRDDNSWGFEFYEMRLTDEEKAHFENWVQSEGWIHIDDLALIVENEYKLSVTYNIRNDTWYVSLTGHSEHPINPSRVMTSRHNTLHAALSLAYFKHAVLSEGGEWRNDKNMQTWG